MARHPFSHPLHHPPVPAAWSRWQGRGTRTPPFMHVTPHAHHPCRDGAGEGTGESGILFPTRGMRMTEGNT
ncbi:hypothetical protein C3920_00615 [Novacetimonas pomaceti]|uniref:Uncharacterized protein n=1 Tax=Novacetimonas pomaceti TaxID=2021998 RepID=A0A318Q9M3_9PROT|nr:hypothetical protein C3920_00615 [Novacetimonas pomaceti]PYD75585.1 hypothetical protein CFR71_08375 [Novacetimonas pomaceti]